MMQIRSSSSSFSSLFSSSEVSLSDLSSSSSAFKDLIWCAFPFPFPLFHGLNFLCGFPLNLPFDDLKFCCFLFGLGQSVTTVPRSYISRLTFRICPSFSSMTSSTFYDFLSLTHAYDFHMLTISHAYDFTCL